MKFLRSEEVTSWCNDLGLRITSDRYVRYLQEAPCCFSVSTEDRSTSRVLALAEYLVPSWDAAPFDGALFWIRQRGVWGDYSEETGSRILQSMRLAGGETQDLERTPGHLFGANELAEMHSFFVLPFLFGWDAFLVLQNREYFLFVSHDGFVEVVSRTKQASTEVWERVRDWAPRQDENWYSQIARD